MGNLSTNFDRSEFACQDNCGRDDISLDLVNRLQLFRNKVGVVLIISGIRCEKHNKDEGGVDNSDHIGGWAVDVHCPEIPQWMAVQAAFLVGFQQVGFGESKLHLGMKPGRMRFWLYKKDKEHVA